MGKSCRGELELSAEPRTCSLVSNPCLQATVVVVVGGGTGEDVRNNSQHLLSAYCMPWFKPSLEFTRSILPTVGGLGCH